VRIGGLLQGDSEKRAPSTPRAHARTSESGSDEEKACQASRKKQPK